MQVIYVERAIQAHDRVKTILARYPNKQVIYCDHYGEIFNRGKQDFRQQKRSPALILAEKKGKRVLPTPESFGIGGQVNYYFSHLLNCPFDCRYCFLQGMYQSAHYVLFVNYEEFMGDITTCIDQAAAPCTFFSGYDADSLAYEPTTQFIATFLPFFAKHPNATLELRTKSANVTALLQHPPVANCVVAFSLTPDVISQRVENKVPALTKRLHAMAQVAEHGYPIGLRFDPLIDANHFEALYAELIQQVFTHVPPKAVHSVSTGVLRFPEKMHKAIHKLYPNEPLLSQTRHKEDGIISYTKDRESDMKKTITTLLSPYISEDMIFACHQ